MNTKQHLARPRLIISFLAAVSACVIAIGLFATVTSVFQRDGKPMEQLVAAERACVEHAYVSEREACMRQWLAASRSPRMATK